MNITEYFFEFLYIIPTTHQNNLMFVVFATITPLPCIEKRSSSKLCKQKCSLSWSMVKRSSSCSGFGFVVLDFLSSESLNTLLLPLIILSQPYSYNVNKNWWVFFSIDLLFSEPVLECVSLWGAGVRGSRIHTIYFFLFHVCLRTLIFSYSKVYIWIL